MTMFETADMSEMEIRDAFGFTKTKPIVFKERGEDGQTIKTLSVSSMKLIRLDTDGKMGSLAITLEDGRELRICSAYLKEMQAARARRRWTTRSSKGCGGSACFRSSIRAAAWSGVRLSPFREAGRRELVGRGRVVA